MPTDEPKLLADHLGLHWPALDPFLFCAHHDDRYPVANADLGPAASLDGRDLGQDFAGKDGWRMYHGTKVPGFPVHPHRGFETVTLVRKGLIDHADSLGATARFGGGDVQWLTAGAGIQHSEMFPLLNHEGPNRTELFQIWLNLPRKGKFASPYFTMFWNEAVPRHVARDEAGRTTEITVVAGRLAEAAGPKPPPDSWASSAEAAVSIWTGKMAPDARWTLPAARAGLNRVLYFFEGDALKANGYEVPAASATVWRSDLEVALENGPTETEWLLLEGHPLNEPVVQYGPFVMNSRQEIAQAFEDYQRTRFGGWPWKGDDPNHGPSKGRFAHHADGHDETPPTSP